MNKYLNLPGSSLHSNYSRIHTSGLIKPGYGQALKSTAWKIDLVFYRYSVWKWQCSLINHFTPLWPLCHLLAVKVFGTWLPNICLGVGFSLSFFKSWYSTLWSFCIANQTILTMLKVLCRYFRHFLFFSLIVKPLAQKKIHQISFNPSY